MASDGPRKVSRRDLIKGITVVGAAVVGPGAGVAGVAGPTSLSGESAEPATVAEAVQAPGGAPASEVLENLTAAEADTLEAIVARLIPSDDRGPGAKEARAARYIDRALGGALADDRPRYAAGLAALDQRARTSRGMLFHLLPPSDQDALLTELERGAVQGFGGGSAAFFELVRTHTIQGTFGDPFYGGNANFIGWDMIAYPGVRTFVTADDQSMSKPPARIHKSAYDYAMFVKASASNEPHGGTNHGD